MRLGKTSVYGLFAVMYVAKVDHDRPVQGRDIAEAYDIPVEYLLKILQLLARCGILRSARGRAGGFVLGRAADEITLKEIVETLESSSDLASVLDQAIQGHQRVKSALMRLFEHIEEGIGEELCRVTVQHLVGLEDSARPTR